MRDATLLDHPSLLILWRELMDLHVALDDRFELAVDADHRFRTYIETAIARDDYRVRVAEVDGRLAGFVVSCVLPNSPVYRTRWIGYINDLCVTQNQRRHGIGRLLVRDAVSWLRRSGAGSVEVYIADHNHAAQRFWRQMGARPYLQRMSIDPDALFEHDD